MIVLLIIYHSVYLVISLIIMIAPSSESEYCQYVVAKSRAFLRNLQFSMLTLPTVSGANLGIEIRSIPRDQLANNKSAINNSVVPEQALYNWMTRGLTELICAQPSANK